MGDPAARVGGVMARPLPTVEAEMHLDEAYRLLLSGTAGGWRSWTGR